jgi:hypothetical protein
MPPSNQQSLSKMHTRSADYLRLAYPRLGELAALRDERDPERRFGNAYLTQTLGW